LRAEASTLAGLDHPNIVALYDFVEEPDRTWLAEQWVDGAALDAILDVHRRLTPEQSLGVLTGALSGLAYAHDHGVVHRDVAASNVLADMAGTSMLVDFGLAVPVQGSSGSGSAGVVGTPAYLCPEAARGEAVGKPGDVYSAAALAYHLLSGMPVFPGTAWEMVAAHSDRTPPRLTGHGPRLEALLARSLAKDPAARPPDAGAFLAELEEAATERYGAAWRTRASIAGLVASTVGAGAATVAGAAGGAAPTVVADGLPQAVTGASQAVVSTGRRVGVKTLVAAGATAAVVVAGVVVGLTLADNDDGASDAGGAPTSEPTLSEAEQRAIEREEKIEELETAVPTGRYRYQWKGVETRRDGGKANRQTAEGTWNFSAPDCTARGCTGSISSNTPGASLTFTWDGTTMAVDRKPAVERGEKAACVDTVTGEVLPIEESAARWTAAYEYQPAEVTPGPDGTLPDRFRLTREATVTWEFFGTCEKGPHDTVATSATWVLTRVS
jgi:serine/threonine-protein kinase